MRRKVIAMKKPKRGRPVTVGGEKRIEFRLSTKDAALARKMAKRGGVSVSQMLRAAIIGTKTDSGK